MRSNAELAEEPSNPCFKGFPSNYSERKHMESGGGGCRRTHMVSLFSVLCVVLRTGAQDARCHVTQGPGRTSYSVQEVNATGCEYSWSNWSQVVATHLSERAPAPLVLEQSRSLLTIQTCFKRVNYTRNCISEGVSVQATCTATCSVNAELRDDDRGPLIQIRCHTFILVPAFLAVLLVLFLTIRRRKHYRSNTAADAEAHG